MRIISRRKLFRKLLIFGLIICLIIYNYVIYKISYLFNGYFVNTRGCRIPAMDVSSPTINQYIKILPEIRCPNKMLIRTRNYEGESYLELNMDEFEIMESFNVSKIKNLHCTYIPFHRKNDFLNMYEDPIQINLKLGVPKKVGRGMRMMRVECVNEKKITIYKDVHFFIPPPTEDEEAEANKREAEQLSVMVFGIDSVSHLNFLRQMKSTTKFIRNELSHVEFWGYNRVGSNSYLSLMSLLSGLSDERINFLCKLNDFNNCPFIWKEFEAAGYKTSFAEDSNTEGIFNDANHEFGRQPTHFYMRPVFVEMGWNSRYFDSHPDIRCCAGRTYSQVMWEYLHKLLPHLKIYPFFSYFWNMEGTQDDFNFPKTLDKKYLSTLKLFQESGVLNKTLLFFMADQGIRLGDIRQTFFREESQPFLFILYPEWMEKLYPTAIQNLKSNARSLVTTFDLHETMRDVLEPIKLSQNSIMNRTLAMKDKLFRGISLFLHIPDRRTCKDAKISEYLCLCQ